MILNDLSLHVADSNTKSLASEANALTDCPTAAAKLLIHYIREGVRGDLLIVTYK